MVKSQAVIATDEQGKVIYSFQTLTLAAQYGFNVKMIRKCISGHAYKHGGYLWRKARASEVAKITGYCSFKQSINNGG